MAYITKKTTRNGVKPIGSNLFGLCSTASASAQKSVSMSDFNVLVSGVTIHVYFAYGNTAQNPTLSVGSTAGVAIKRNGILGGKWSNGSVISFTYDGTNWIQNDADDGSESVTYGLSLNGNQLSLVEGGQTQSVTLTDEDTTYSLSINGNVLTLTDSDGNHDDVTLPGADVFYPIGSYLETSDSLFDPNTAFGGTWVSETIKDEHIVDQGTTSGWTWKKWSSGRYEAERTINYGQITAATVLATIEGNLKLFISTAIPTNVPSPPHTLTSGTIEYEYLGNDLGYSFIFRTTQNKIQIGRLGVSSSETAFSNVMLLYRVVGGLWKTYVAPTTIYRWHRTA